MNRRKTRRIGAAIIAVVAGAAADTEQAAPVELAVAADPGEHP
jgi:hypothetical protein